MGRRNFGIGTFISIGNRRLPVESGGKLTPTFASGRAFPIWHTVVGTDKLLSLSIHGLTEQNGTPTPEVPVPIQSVGDSGLLLSIMQDKTGGDYQLLDIGGAMRKAGHDGVLRSCGDVYDEIVYTGKWQLIQRIGISKGYNVNNVMLDAENGNLAQYQVLGSPKGGSASTAYPAFMSNKFYFIGDSTSSKWGKVYGVWTNSLRYRFYCIADKSSYPDTASFKTLASDVTTIYYYVLTTPVEYALDLPVVSTYDKQTYFATNPTSIKPYMEVECMVSKSIEPIKENLVWWFELSPKDWINNKIISKIDETDYLEAKNFAGTKNSGPNENYIQFDGVDDYFIIHTSKQPQAYQLLMSDPVKKGINCWMLSSMGDGNNGFLFNDNSLSIDEKALFMKLFLNNEPYLTNEIAVSNIMGSNSNLISAVYNREISIDNLGTYKNLTVFCANFRGHLLLAYSNKINQNVVENNLKYCKQRFGDNFDGYTM